MKIIRSIFFLGFLMGWVGGVKSQDPVDLVYPFLDAANSRWIYFSSACRPFGMVNLSPDTEINGTWGSGYVYDAHEIKGFSHIHAWQLSGLSVMPITGGKAVTPIRRDYYSSFSHDSETAYPGYHSVVLDRYGIRVELTSTVRAGFHRYDYPDGVTPKILVNLDDPLGPSKMQDGKIRLKDDYTLTGSVVNARTVRRPKPVTVYFYIRLDKPVIQMDGWKGIRPKYKIRRLKGHNMGAILTLDADPDEPVMMKVGISYVSIRQAKINLETEIPDWNFDRVVNESKREWNSLLSRIRISGGTKQDQRRFYTDLWHALQGRRIISDVNGKYPDHTGKRKRICRLPLDEAGKPLFSQYNSDSYWGTQWTLNTLWDLVYPEVTSEFCNSLLQYYHDGGLIPRGPSGGMYTYVMTGASSTPFIVSAYQKGIRDFDIETAYEGLRKNHMPGGLMGKAGYEHGTSEGGGIEYYMNKGYVPYPLGKKLRAFHLQGAGQTLEYAYQDWTLAQLAKALDKTDDYHYFLERSKNYRNLWDPRAKFMVPKTRRGLFLANYDPYAYADGFVESNAAQATWYVPHDIPGLAALMGGNNSLVRRLDEAFKKAELQGFTAGKGHAQENDPEWRRVPVNYGNQPSMHTAFIFDLAGAPELTQKWSRAVVDNVFSGLSPYEGYRGDEDQGQMGALAVLMKIGLFQVDGGCTEDPVYQIGSPLFDRVEIELNPDYYPGKKFVIRSIRNSRENIYIQSLKLNGKEIRRYELQHSEIVGGGELVLIKSDKTGK
ncbi:MAG: GH92 family glycosyl hydrolase [Bacteroidales bacterium]|nr:GH92 family glycosyl hydrolase [Bacteroidales bacterium]